jgi:hypothetical protein
MRQSSVEEREPPMPRGQTRQCEQLLLELLTAILEQLKIISQKLKEDK